MASDDSSNSADTADALVCQATVLLLRAGQEASLAGEDLAGPLDRLLSAVSLERPEGARQPEGVLGDRLGEVPARGRHGADDRHRTLASFRAAHRTAPRS